MFDFTKGVKKKKVQAIFTNRMNQKCLEEMQGTDRGPDRSSFVRVVVAVPRSKPRKWAFDQAFPVLSGDISPEGMSLLHTEELSGEMLVEIPLDNAVSLVRCTVQHSSPLGYGYFHTGLRGEEVVSLESRDRKTLDERMAEFETTEASA